MVIKSTVGIKLPSLDETYHPNRWLESKRAVDNVGDLWRIHNRLYDFTNFIKMHPGGQFWLRETQGMDITEAFESHHLSTIPETLLKHYYVRECYTSRSSPFTFHKEGFYKTLKENTRKIFKNIPEQPRSLSNMYADGLLIGTFLSAIVALKFWSFYIGVVSGLLLSLTITSAHNYCHQRDNMRMYYSDICMESSRDWRIFHVLSHHLFTNTIADLQAFGLEPLIITFPEKKSLMVKYGSWIYLPFILWPLRCPQKSLFRLRKLLFGKFRNTDLVDILPFLLPLSMYLLSGQSLWTTFIMWEFILALGGFSLSAIAFTSSHFHPDIFIDGDAPREEKDWGIFQMDCIAERKEVVGNQFLVLMTFGDHTLHHLFPTLDHGMLPYLYPVLFETMEQFNLPDLKMKSTADMIVGYFRQIAREKPNLLPPGYKS